MYRSLGDESKINCEILDQLKLDEKGIQCCLLGVHPMAMMPLKLLFWQHTVCPELRRII
jgi:hypothetical protein